jgi:hypothetical protein
MGSPTTASVRGIRSDQGCSCSKPIQPWPDLQHLHLPFPSHHQQVTKPSQSPKGIRDSGSLQAKSNKCSYHSIPYLKNSSIILQYTLIIIKKLTVPMYLILRCAQVLYDGWMLHRSPPKHAHPYVYPYPRPCPALESLNNPTSPSNQSPVH